MVREILTKGQVGSNFQQHPICMNDISNYSSQLVHSKYIYLSYLSFHFWNKPICLNSDHDCSGRSTQVQTGDYWLQEINNPHNSVNRLNWFGLAYDYSHQIWISYYFVFSSYEISKTLNAGISKLVLLHLSTSSTTYSIVLRGGGVQILQSSHDLQVVLKWLVLGYVWFSKKILKIYSI